MCVACLESMRAEREDLPSVQQSLLSFKQHFEGRRLVSWVGRTVFSGSAGGLETMTLASGFGQVRGTVNHLLSFCCLLHLHNGDTLGDTLHNDGRKA